MELAINRGVKPRRQVAISSQVFGALLFVFVDLMFFSAFYSSYFVIKRGRVWELPANVQVPQFAAAVAVIPLLVSGLALFLAGRAFVKQKDYVEARRRTLQAIGFAMVFLGLQGHLLFSLFNSGLTMNSGLFGACFFLIVAAHAVHVFVGILTMFKLFSSIGDQLEPASLKAMQVVWLFVVGVWPVFYAEIFF